VLVAPAVTESQASTTGEGSTAGSDEPIDDAGMVLPVAGAADEMEDGGIAGLVLRGGIEYVEQCVGYPEPGSLCADREAVRAGLVCAYGTGDECRGCPAGAACPGGYKAHPLPGYWSQEEDSDLVLRCDAPAEERCLGWDAELEQSLCGAGYRQGSTACSRCEDGRYPESDGSCQLCPSSPSIWLLLQPLVLYAGGVAGAAFFLLVSVSIVAYSRGIPLRLAATRAAQFTLYTGALLQTVAQAGRAVQPGLPQWYYTVVRMLDVLRFESAALVHPDCIGGTKLAQEMLVLSISIMLALGGYVTFWCTGLPVVVEATDAGRKDEAIGGSAGLHETIGMDRPSTEEKPAQEGTKTCNPLRVHRRRRSNAGMLLAALESSSSSSATASTTTKDTGAQPGSAGPSEAGVALRGDGSASLGIAARAMLTVTSLLYAVTCTTVVQVLDCGPPVVLTSVADPDAV